MESNYKAYLKHAHPEDTYEYVHRYHKAASDIMQIAWCNNTKTLVVLSEGSFLLVSQTLKSGFESSETH